MRSSTATSPPEARDGKARHEKLHYYPETDSLYIDPNAKPGTDSQEVADGLVVDFDAEGDVVGIDIQQASRTLDLATLETVALPLVNLRMA